MWGSLPWLLNLKSPHLGEWAAVLSQMSPAHVSCQFFVSFFFWRSSIWEWNPKEHRARVPWSPRRTRSKRKPRSQRSQRWFYSPNSLEKIFWGMSKPIALGIWMEAILDLDWGFNYKIIRSAIFGSLRVRLAIAVTQNKGAHRLLTLPTSSTCRSYASSPGC